MDVFFAKDVVYIVDSLTELFRQMQIADPNAKLGHARLEECRDVFALCAEQAATLKLEGTCGILRRWWRYMDWKKVRPTVTPRDVMEYVREARNRFDEEAALVACVALDFYNLPSNDHPFGEEVSKAFPDAYYDMVEANLCLLFERSTAAVFHSMRVLEHGLKRLAQLLGVPVPPESWGKILQPINDEIKKKKHDDPEVQFYSQAAVQLKYLKDAWRNQCMHSSVTYDQEEAREILGHVKSFMEDLCRKPKQS